MSKTTQILSAPEMMLPAGHLLARLPLLMGIVRCHLPGPDVRPGRRPDASVLRLLPGGLSFRAHDQPGVDDLRSDPVCHPGRLERGGPPGGGAFDGRRRRGRPPLSAASGRRTRPVSLESRGAQRPAHRGQGPLPQHELSLRTSRRLLRRLVRHCLVVQKEVPFPGQPSRPGHHATAADDECARHRRLRDHDHVLHVRLDHVAGSPLVLDGLRRLHFWWIADGGAGLAIHLAAGRQWRRQSTGRVVNSEHYHDVGKLLFGFVVFWAYIGFSQFMLIWYANIPEETLWFAHRMRHGWYGVTLVLVVGHFVIPLLSAVVPRRQAAADPARTGGLLAAADALRGSLLAGDARSQRALQPRLDRSDGPDCDCSYLQSRSRPPDARPVAGTHRRSADSTSRWVSRTSSQSRSAVSRARLKTPSREGDRTANPGMVV